MHLQAAEDHDVFARSLSIGPETMVMHFLPDQPMHARYAVDHDFLSPQAGDECITINRTVNAFFKWEFNSCEMLVKRGTDGQPDQVYPIDYANACPDVAITSLHYYFPWAMKALVKWSAYCLVTAAARPRVDMQSSRYNAIADRDDLTYEEKLAALPHAVRRVLRGRPVLRLVRLPAAQLRPDRPRVVQRARDGRGDRRHRPRDVPRRTSTTSSSSTTAA